MNLKALKIEICNIMQSSCLLQQQQLLFYNINVEMLEQSKMQIDSLQNDLGDPRFDRNALHWIFQAYLVHLENK